MDKANDPSKPLNTDTDEKNFEKYNKFNFVSPCCLAFNYYDNNNIFCSKCGKIVRTLDKNEQLTINVKFNVHEEDNEKNNISGDIINIYNNNAKKFANDPTCEKIEKQCPSCKNPTARYLRNPQDEIIFVCDKCRAVFNNYGTILA